MIFVCLRALYVKITCNSCSTLVTLHSCTRKIVCRGSGRCAGCDGRGSRGPPYRILPHALPGSVFVCAMRQNKCLHNFQICETHSWAKFIRQIDTHFAKWVRLRLFFCSSPAGWSLLSLSNPCACSVKDFSAELHLDGWLGVLPKWGLAVEYSSVNIHGYKLVQDVHCMTYIWNDLDSYRFFIIVQDQVLLLLSQVHQSIPDQPVFPAKGVACNRRHSGGLLCRGQMQEW